MNKERIRELALEADLAGAVLGDLLQNHDRWHDLTPHIEKFTQLVVHECAKVCADNGMRAGGGCTDTGEVYLEASKAIRRHFGMETWGLY